MRLYKYITADRIDVLLNGLIRFTQAADFNDPFEVVPHVAAFLPPGHEDRYLSQFEPDSQKMLEEAIDKELAVRGLPSHLAAFGKQFALSRVRGTDVIGLMKALLPQIVEHLKPTFGRDFQERFGERFGILSLSETPTSLLMWAHYADCHRGLVFEFDASHLFFHQRTSAGVIGKLRQVVYAVARPAIVAYDPSVPAEELADRLIADLLLTKGVDWQYEREWRLIYPLDDLAGHPHSVNGRLHLFPIPRRALTAVVLGSRVSDATLSAVRAALSASSESAHVELRRCHTSDTKYEVIVEAPAGP
jgi:hypothetical protein